MNISKETIEKLKGLGYIFTFWDEYVNEVSPEKSTELSICAIDINGEYQILYPPVRIKTTKKETTLEYILNKMNNDKVYQNFSEYFNKLLKSKNYTNYNTCPTTYGIGVWVSFGFRKNIEETKQNIENLLNELNIIYTTEYSDAGWVFRYKISKSKENIAIIEKIINNQ